MSQGAGVPGLTASMHSKGRERSRGPTIRETVSTTRKGEGRARTTVVHEMRPAGDAAFLRVIAEVSERRARLLGVDMSGKGAQTPDAPPVLNVIVNEPKDNRRWHEKVFDATGDRIPPQAADGTATEYPD